MTVKATWLRGHAVWSVRSAQLEWGCFPTPAAAREAIAQVWGLDIVEWTVCLRSDPYEEATLDPANPENLRGL